MSPLVVALYIAAGFISILVAGILAYLARLKGNVKAGKAVSGFQDMPNEAKEYEPLYKYVCQEINQAIGSNVQSKQIGKQVVSIMDKEIKKHTGLVTQELSKKYETIISEKEKDKEIAWNKYKKVAESKKTTESVVRSLSEGLVVVDTKGKVVMMNPAAEKLLGSPKKDRLNKPITSGLKDEHLLSFVSGSEEKGNKEIELFSKEDQTRKTLRSSSAVIEDEYGQTVGMVSGCFPFT